MKLKNLYLILCIIGTALPYSAFLPWMMNNGLNVSLLLQEIIASRIASFGWADVLISAVTLLVFIFAERRENTVKHIWLPVLGTFFVGTSLGFPLYLYLRESAKER